MHTTAPAPNNTLLLPSLLKTIVENLSFSSILSCSDTIFLTSSLSVSLQSFSVSILFSVYIRITVFSVVISSGCVIDFFQLTVGVTHREVQGPSPRSKRQRQKHSLRVSQAHPRLHQFTLASPPIQQTSFPFPHNNHFY